MMSHALLSPGAGEGIAVVDGAGCAQTARAAHALGCDVVCSVCSSRSASEAGAKTFSFRAAHSHRRITFLCCCSSQSLCAPPELHARHAVGFVLSHVPRS